MCRGESGFGDGNAVTRDRHLFRGEPRPRDEKVGAEAPRDRLEVPAKILRTTFWT